MLIATQVFLMLATLLCSLVAGFLFAFAVVVMPGTRALDDRDFLRAFQAMDGVIQRGQPLFGLVWIGSALSLVVGLVLGLGQLDGLNRQILILAAGVYLLGVQVPTFGANIPLNNEVQAIALDDSEEATLRKARARFEPRWNRWNTLRTALAILTSALLTVLLMRL